MNTLRRIRALYRDMRHGWLSITIFYTALTAIAYALYYYLTPLSPNHSATLTVGDLWQWPGQPLAGLRQVWWLFAWGFGLQFVVQIWQVIQRRPKEAGLRLMIKHGLWVSGHAGLFEELVFRLYGFLAAMSLLEYINHLVAGWLSTAATSAILPVADAVTLGFLHQQLRAEPWSVGVAIIIGSWFFSSAHIHYGRFSKVNVWLIGLVMFWLTFNYGLLTAILAHIIYDFAVYVAIALSSPFQPHAPGHDHL